MVRKRLFVVTMALLLIVVMSSVSGPSVVDVDLVQFVREFSPAGAGDNWEIYVQQISDLHPEDTDIGTHSAFVEMQDKDGVWDTLTEADVGAGADYTDYVDSNSTDIDGGGDIGTNVDFTQMQSAPDTVDDTLTEEDVGWAGGSEWLSVNAFDSTYDGFDITAGDSPWLGAQDQPTHMRGEVASGGAQLGWFDFPSTTLSGSLTVNISCYTDSSDGDDWLDVWVDYTGAGAGSDVGNIGLHVGWQYDTISLGTRSVAEVNALRVYFVYQKGGGGDDVWIDHVRVGVSVTELILYQLDKEYQWTAAEYGESNEEICLKMGSLLGGEPLELQYWDGDSWESGGSTLGNGGGWNNRTIYNNVTGNTFTIRFIGDYEVTDTTQGSWEFDSLLLHTWSAASTDYDLDLEVGWTSADFDETDGEELCVFGGTQGSEALRVDVWNDGGSAWVNVFTDIVAGWNNVSVATWLVDATFEIRFVDTTGDSVEADEWQVEGVMLHVWTDVAANNVPVNDQVPTLDNGDDTTFMYAQYREYKITMYVSDADGFADIDYLELSLWDNTQTTEYFRFRYDEDTDTFTEEYDSGTVVVLNTGLSVGTETGNDIDAQFWFTVDWDFADLTDVDMECYVIDDEPESDSDFYEADFDVETRLDYSVAPIIISDDSGTVDRGDLDESFLLGGTLIYYGSGDDVPASDQVDVWVAGAEYGTNVGPWSDTTLTSGAFEVTCYGDDVVGIDTHTVKPVLEAAGSGGASQYYTTDLTDDYISDRIQVQSYTITDDRVDLNANVDIDILLYYDYDDSAVVTGTFTVNGNSLTHQAAGTWRFTDSESTVVENTYDTVAGSDTTHGISVVDQNSQSDTVIWDQIVVVSYTIVTPAGDDRVDTGATVTIDVELHYDFDNTDLVDGTVTVNGLSTTYQSLGKWRFTDSEATVMMNTYNAVACTGNAEGITVEDNTVIEEVIWDQVRVVSYTFISGDGRVNTDATVTIDVELHYDYDETDVVDGTVTVNGLSTVYQSVGKWRFSDSESTVMKNTYDVVACTGNAEGITVEDNSVTEEVIWDRLVVTIVVDDETPANGVTAFMNATSGTTVVFDYDSSACTTYQIVIDRNATAWYSFTNGNLTLFKDTNTDKVYNYTTGSVTSESLYGIISFTTNLVTVTWSAAANNAPVNDIDPVIDNADDGDNLYAKYRFYIVISNVSDLDTYSDINYVELSIWDDARGTEYICLRYTVSGSVWSVEVGSGFVTLLYSSVSESGDDIDITWSFKVDWDFPDLTDLDLDQYVYDGTDNDQDWYEANWDIETRLEYSVVPGLSDDRGDTDTSDLVGSGTVIYYTSVNDFPLANETDIWIVHDVSGTWSGNVDGVGAYSVSSVGSSASVRENTYTFKTVIESAGSGGTDLYYTSSLTDAFITDRLTITFVDPTDQRIDIGANASGMVVSAIYQYDSGAFDGTFMLNDTTYDYGVVGKYGYTVTSVSGDTYDVTVIGTNDDSFCVFDSLVAYITPPTDQRNNINANATGMVVWANYSYDTTSYDGTFTLNDEDYSKSSVTNSSYYISVGVGDDTHGITVVGSKNETWCIFDRMVVSFVADSETPDNDVQVNFTLTVIWDYDDVACTVYLVAIEVDAVHWHSFDNSNKSLFVKSNSDETDVFTTGSITESTHGITEYVSSSVEVVWGGSSGLMITYTFPDSGVKVAPGVSTVGTFTVTLFMIVVVGAIIGGYLHYSNFMSSSSMKTFRRYSKRPLRFTVKVSRLISKLLRSLRRKSRRVLLKSRR